MLNPRHQRISHVLAAVLVLVLVLFAVLLFRQGRENAALLSMVWGLFGVGVPYLLKVVVR